MCSGLFTGNNPTRQSCQEVNQYLAGRVGSGQELSEICRDGSGRVRRFSYLAGRDGLPDST